MTHPRQQDPHGALEGAHVQLGLDLATALLARTLAIQEAGSCLRCVDQAWRRFTSAHEAAWTAYAQAVEDLLPTAAPRAVEEALKAFDAEATPRLWRSGERA